MCNCLFFFVFCRSERMIPPRLVVIANPDSLRYGAYATEVAAFRADRGIPLETELVSWREVILRSGNLDGLAAFDRPAVVRLESPGRDWDVARLLLAAGARGTPDEGPHWLDLAPRKGWLVRPGLFYEGFRRVLDGLRGSFESRTHLRPTACPRDVAEMFDKNATCDRLVAAGVPSPPTLETSPGSATALLAEVRRRRWATTYVKLNTGSSASAIAVLRGGEGEPWCASSSAVRLDGEFFSSRRLARYSGADLDAVLEFLLGEGACVQQGIRMAQVDGCNFDVRCVLIHGAVAFTIFRLSPGPMTNLHLGGRRGEPAVCRAAVPTRAWLDAMDDCVATAQLYRADMVGVDLLFESGYARHYILEVNAFGDFFPNLTDQHGRNVYRVELEALTREMGWAN
jgi:hypothetical protein